MYFTDAHEELRLQIRRFLEKEVKPHLAEWEETLFPDSIFKKFGDQGLLGLRYDPEFGGQGGDYFSAIVLEEEMARVGSGGLGMAVAVQTEMATPPLNKFGTPEQKRKWLPRLASGDVLGAFALTEPASGSDAASLQASARRTGDGYVLNGTKIFITNVGRAGLYIVFARSGTEERAAGVSAFLVPAGTPGLRVGQVFKKMGLNGSPTGELVLEDVAVPAENRLGAEGQGFTVAMRALDSGRIGISGQALGIAQAAVDESRAVLAGRGRERSVSHNLNSLASQGDEFLLADMATRLESARLLAYHAAWLCSRGRPFTRQASMAKLHCTDTAMQVALDASQLAGDDGTFSGSPFERHVRDAKALQIYEGSNQVQRMVIAREILR